MAKQTINQLKQWFQTGLFPVQQQFWDWLDSFRHKDDAIALNDVTGLVDILNSKQDVLSPNVILLAAGVDHWDVPAGTMIEKIWFQLTTDAAISVGKTIGANDVYEEGANVANGEILLTGDRPFREAATIYFNGIQKDTITIIYKR